ncbi:MAG TPA: TetR family transcriptional regulator [Propionicimonas sp.]|nr:TetR family transcriptional regulator [Propionicimonas sp.]HRA05845.1 TetR family transcriptional regulator [Propionicimonas sp.]
MQVTVQGHRPRGRRPGRLDTRGVIQDAALGLFSEQGYEKVSLRAIARAADVDPALIHHYFENKADLFSRSVLDLPLNTEGIVARVLDGPTETIGDRMMTEILGAWDQPGARERFTAMLRAAVTNPGARRPLSEFLAKELMIKVAEAQGHANAKLRAQTAVSIVLGLALCRDVLHLTALAKARNPVLINSLGRALQTQLVDTW